MFTREGRIGCMLWAGLGLIILGFGLSFVMMLGGLASVAMGSRDWFDASVIPLSLVIVGVLLCAFNLARMWWIPYRAAHAVVKEEVPGAYVVAKSAFDRSMNMSFPSEPDTDLRYYVTLQLPGGKKAEFRTAMETFFTIGEGAIGTATVQGDWLGMFITTGTPRHLSE